MIKYIEAPDLHYDHRWADILAQVINSIKKTAIKNSVNFIAVPGDLYNSPLIASEKSGLNQLRRLILDLSDICPVVAIEGTPSHDAPGCYESLAGLTLLKPGIIYGYISNKIKRIQPETEAPEIILFGLPEPNKDLIMAESKMTAEAANAESIKRFNAYVADFIAPVRLMYKDIPAIALFHGNVSDFARENELDKIFKASDIVIHTQDMKIANLTRWALGHIHTPWESTVINAGYAGFSGMDSNPWGKTGFVPAMNLVTIDKTVNIERVPYGTPMRLKITEPLDSYDPNIAYWLHTNNEDAPIPSGHPWNKKTINDEKTITRRVTSDQIQDASLVDLFKLIDPNVSKSIIEKVETIQKKEELTIKKAKNIKLKRLEISGCDFFKGKKVIFDIDNLLDGLNMLIGENGEGKSALLSFCSYWPVVIGKDTDFGQSSAIKDFFHFPDAQIIKDITCNDECHRHIINIKASHTKNPKVECFLYVNDANKLEKGSFDEMYKTCTDLYGSLEEYILTTFQIQPLQSKMQQGLSLMDANITNIRNLVQSIAGVDREKEKRFALDKAKLITGVINENNAWLKGAKDFTESSIEQSEKIHIDEKKLKKVKAVKLNKNYKLEISVLQKTVAINKSEIEKKEKNEKRSKDIQEEISQLESNIDMLEINKSLLGNEKLRVERMAYREKIINSNRTLKNNYDSNVNTFNKLYNEEKLKAATETNKNKLKYETDLNNYNNHKSQLETFIRTNDTPCPKCGYIPDDAKNSIEKAKKELASLIKPTGYLKVEMKPILMPVPETPKYQNEPDIETSEIDIAELETIINNSEKDKNNIELLKKELIELAMIKYKIIESADDKLNEYLKKQELEDTKSFRLQLYIKNLETVISNSKKNLYQLIEKENKIKNTEQKIEIDSLDLADWNYISSMLSANKIPAMELEIILDQIDRAATENIKPYKEGRFKFETATKDGDVDRFNIYVYDQETAEKKSLLKYSPGVKAFLSDAYVKALITIRNNRHKILYNPIISDEADGPIQPSLISSYYEIQKKYYEDLPIKVICVSHAPDAHQYVQNNIFMKNILTNVLE